MPANPTLFAKYLNPLFIETGSYIGDGIGAALAAGFTKIISIELSPTLVLTCRLRFVFDERVRILCGDSTICLPEVLAGVTVPVTFWLDGHYSSGDTGRGAKISPLMEELAAIAAHPVKTHTILIDDMRAWRQPHVDFTKADIEAAIMAINPAYSITYANGHVPGDILVATCKQ